MARGIAIALSALLMNATALKFIGGRAKNARRERDWMSDFADFEMGSRARLLHQFPAHAGIIRRLTR
jgi:hypothetical protein